MTRLTFAEALNTATEADAARALDLIEAKRTLENTLDEAYRGLDRLNAEIRVRSAALCIREMNADLTHEDRAVRALKGMIA